MGVAVCSPHNTPIQAESQTGCAIRGNLQRIASLVFACYMGFMKGTALLPASVVLAAIIYAFASRYEGHVVSSGQPWSRPTDTYTQVLDRWTGKTK